MARFTQSWQDVAELQANRASRQLSDRGIRAAFSLLEDFDIGEVCHAIRLHCRGSARVKASRWMPTVADLVEIIEGTLPNDQAIKQLAIDGNTPLGIKARQLAGNHTMTKKSDREIFYAIQGIRPKLEEYFHRTRTGGFTNDELLRCQAAGVDPRGELAPNVPGPRSPYLKPLNERVQALADRKQLGDGKTPETEAKVTTEEALRARDAALESMSATKHGVENIVFPPRKGDDLSGTPGHALSHTADLTPEDLADAEATLAAMRATRVDSPTRAASLARATSEAERGARA